MHLQRDRPAAAPSAERRGRAVASQIDADAGPTGRTAIVDARDDGSAGAVIGNADASSEQAGSEAQQSIFLELKYSPLAVRRATFCRRRSRRRGRSGRTDAAGAGAPGVPTARGLAARSRFQ